jgi:hypothetical protein
MLGEKMDKDIFALIGKRVILHDTEPLEVEVIDVDNGQVLYESLTGGTGSLSIAKFKEIVQVNI